MTDSVTSTSVPPPDLKILPMERIFPHEDHDSQRSGPLLNILKQAEYLTNPPIVAPMSDGNYVLLDGSNRYHCFCELGYDQLLVQVAPYESEHVELGVWQHVVSGWDQDEFLSHLRALDHMTIKQGWDYQAVAQILLRDGLVLSIDAPADTIEDRNHTLRQIVNIYQQQAHLGRTASKDPTTLWHLHPDAIALVLFPPYRPEDIIAAAQHRAFLPPGVSRHIIEGRALKLNYPLSDLRDTDTALDEKNAALKQWMTDKIAQREMRFYAESTYIFDE